jgi:hypothetical protein
LFTFPDIQHDLSRQQFAIVPVITSRSGCALQNPGLASTAHCKTLLPGAMGT